METMAELATEEAAELLNRLIENSTRKHAKSGAKQGLIAKLSAYGEDFPISEYSAFSDDNWLLHIPDDHTPYRIDFSKFTGSEKALRKSLCYYFLPDFTHFPIRSFATSTLLAHSLKLVAKYVFRNHGIDITESTIRSVTGHQIISALNESRHHGNARDFPELFGVLRRWYSLSSSSLLPEGLCLPSDCGDFDSEETRSAVQSHLKATITPWEPYSDEDLEELFTFSLFWLEKALPRLLAVKEKLSEHGYWDNGNKGSHIRSAHPLPEVEACLNIEIDGIEILRVVPSLKTYEHKARISKEGWKRSARTESIYFYHWFDQFSAALDKVRLALYVVVATLTGLRSREIRRLKFDAFNEKADGSWVLDFVRYKTTADPAYSGEADSIPIPTWICLRVREFVSLKQLSWMKTQEFLWQSCQSRKKLNAATPGVIRNMTDGLQALINVDDIHNHRFRKTIAAILIRRDEKNVDIIRHLFGHESYSMTLQYISRNPLLVEEVVNVFTRSLTEKITALIHDVEMGKISQPVDQLGKNRLAEISRIFRGKNIRISIYAYITYQLERGVYPSLVLSSIGAYCTAPAISEAPLPCSTASLIARSSTIVPDPNNCQLECDFAAFRADSLEALLDSVAFYEKLVANSVDTKADMRWVAAKLSACRRHIANLSKSSISTPAKRKVDE